MGKNHLSVVAYIPAVFPGTIHLIDGFFIELVTNNLALTICERLSGYTLMCVSFF